MHYLRPYNDLHNEFAEIQLPVLEHESNTVVSLAGDIYGRKTLIPWVRTFAHRFKAVVIVLGNHDYWGGSMDLVVKFMKQQILDRNLDNVFLLDNHCAVIDGVMYYGGTMWTDYNKGDPLTLQAYLPFKDYKQIRTHSYMKKVTPAYLIGKHKLFIQNLETWISDPHLKQFPIVVISHHGPTYKSIVAKYAGDRIHNGFYCSDLSDLILDNPRIKLWHHGHTHEYLDYLVGDDCRVICNPNGYAKTDDNPEMLVPEFNPTLVFEMPSVQVVKLMNNVTG